MNLYSNGEKIIRATGKAYEAIYQAQGFRPYVEEVEIDNADNSGARGEDDGEQPDKAGEPNGEKTDENGVGAADTGKGKKPAARRKPATDK